MPTTCCRARPMRSMSPTCSAPGPRATSAETACPSAPGGAAGQLVAVHHLVGGRQSRARVLAGLQRIDAISGVELQHLAFPVQRATADRLGPMVEIGRASCRERVCQYGTISVVAVSLKKTLE